MASPKPIAKCKNCKTPVTIDAGTCPGCGHELPDYRRRLGLACLITGIASLAVFFTVDLADLPYSRGKLLILPFILVPVGVLLLVGVGKPKT